MKPFRLSILLLAFTSVVWPLAATAAITQPPDPRIERLFYLGINGSVFDTHCAALEKSGDMEALQARISAIAAAAPDESNPVPASRQSSRPNGARVTKGLLLERAGKVDEARKEFAESGVAGAWHLARLGDTKPLLSMAPSTGVSSEWRVLVMNLVREPDAAYRAKSQALMNSLLTSTGSITVRVPLLCGLAEFAFQDGKLDAFVAEAEKQAGADAGPNGASKCLAVSELHGYLYDQAKQLTWRTQALERKPEALEFWIEAVPLFIHFPVPEIQSGPAAAAGYASIVEKILQRPGLPEPLRGEVLRAWMTREREGCLRWLTGHSDDMAFVTKPLLNSIVSASGMDPTLLPLKDTINALCAKQPDNLEFLFLRGTIALTENREADATADFVKVFELAGLLLRKQPRPDEKPSPLSTATVGQNYLSGDESAPAVAAWARRQVWKTLTSLSDPAAMQKRAEQGGPDLFASADEAILLLLESDCLLPALDRMEELLKTPGVLPGLSVLSQLHQKIQEALKRSVVPTPQKERILSLYQKLFERCLATADFSNLAISFIRLVHEHGEPAASASMAKAMAAAADAHPDEPRWRHMASQAATAAGQKPERPEAAVKPPPPAPPVWLDEPLPAPVCGRWFLPFPNPDPNEGMRHGPSRGTAEPSRWQGRYQAPVKGDYLSRRQGTPENMSTLQKLRWALYSRSDNPGAPRSMSRPPGPGRPGGATMPDELDPLLDELLKTAPDDDLRLLKVQVLLAEEDSRMPRPRQDGNVRAVQALEMLKNVTTEAGAYALITARFKSKALETLNDAAGAVTALQVFTARGYTPRMSPALAQQSRKLSPPVPAPAAAPPALTEEERERRVEDEAEQTIIRFRRSQTPETREGLLQTARSLLTTRPRTLDGDRNRLFAAETLGEAGLLDAEVAELEEEMRRDPANTVIPLNLYVVFSWMAGVKNFEPMFGNERWVKYAEYVVKQNTAGEEVAQQLAGYYRSKRQTSEAAALHLYTIRKHPERPIKYWRDAPLAQELHDAGLLDEFVKAKITWLQSLKPRDHERVNQLIVPYQLPDVMPLVEQIMALPGQAPLAKDLLLAAAAAPGTEGSDVKWWEVMAAALPVAEKLGASEALADVVVRKIAPWPEGDSLPAGSVNFQKRDVQLPPNYGFWDRSGKKEAPGLAVVRLLLAQKRLDKVIAAWEAHVFKGQGYDWSGLSSVFLAMKCVRDPEGAKTILSEIFDTGGYVEAWNAAMLPGLTELDWYRVRFAYIKKLPRPEKPGQQTVLGQRLNMTGPAIRAAEKGQDSEFIRELLLDESKLIREWWAARGDIRRDSYLENQLSERISMMIKHGLGAEAEALFREAQPLLGTASPEQRLWILLPLPGAARRAGLDAFAGTLYAAGRKVIDEQSPDKWNAEQARPWLAWAELAIEHGYPDDAQKDVYALRRLPENGAKIQITAKLDVIAARIAHARGQPAGKEFITWPAMSAEGKRLLCWHGGVLRVNLPQNRENNGDFVWPGARTIPGNGGIPAIMVSADGERWKELPGGDAPVIAGSAELTKGGYVRAVQRKDGESVFGPVLRHEEVLYASTTPPAEWFIQRREENPPVMKAFATPPQWKSLTPDGQPGTTGWTATHVLHYGEVISLATAPAPFDPRQQTVFSGWVRVECATRVNVTLTVETAREDGGVESNIETLPIVCQPGAWTFVPPNAQLEHYGSRGHGQGARVRLAVFGGDFGGDPDPNGYSVSISCSDWLLQSLPLQDGPPWPRRMIGCLPSGTGAFALAPDGAWLAAGLKQGGIFRLSTDGAAPVPKPLATLPDPVVDVGIPDTGNSVLAATAKGALYSIDISGGEPRLLRTLEGTPRSVAFSPGGDRAAAWIPKKGWFIAKLKEPDAPVTKLSAPDYYPESESGPAMIFSDDGNRLLVDLRPARNLPWHAPLSGDTPLVFSSVDGTRVSPAVVDDRTVPDIVITRRHARTLFDGVAWTAPTGWKSAVRVGPGSINYNRSDRPGPEPAGAWTLANWRPSKIAFDPQLGVFYTVEESGVVRRWELPKE